MVARVGENLAAMKTTKSASHGGALSRIGDQVLTAHQWPVRMAVELELAPLLEPELQQTGARGGHLRHLCTPPALKSHVLQRLCAHRHRRVDELAVPAKTGIGANDRQRLPFAIGDG